jgi:phosphatidylserine/phosphatidylglycerophosphate/cardiolipin synthase-like enzyme
LECAAAQVRSAIEAAPAAFPRLAAATVCGNVEFVGDRPGKNHARSVSNGGGLATQVLATQVLSSLIRGARHTIAIQSPYLVMSDDAQRAAMEIDMQHGNSWSAALDDPDRNASWLRRSQVRFWRLMPIRSLL